MVRYGLGCELGAAPGWAKATARVMTGNAARNARRFTIGMAGAPCALFHSVAEMKGSWGGGIQGGLRNRMTTSPEICHPAAQPPNGHCLCNAAAGGMPADSAARGGFSTNFWDNAGLKLAAARCDKVVNKTSSRWIVRRS